MKERISELSRLKNIGPTSECWLNSIGVYTVEDLRRLGSIPAYTLLKENGFNVSLNLVFAIEATLLGLHWRELPGDIKAELRTSIKSLGVK